MAEWWDNLKEEIYWPIAQIVKWWMIEDNQTATWLIVGTTAFVALFVYGGLFFGGRRVINALNEDVTITVNEQCVNAKGLVVVNAPSSCFAPKPAPPAPRWTPEQSQTIRNNDATISSPNDSAYNPPCLKDGLPGCTDQIYGKRLVDGIVDTVTFNTDEKQTQDNHLQPDYTEVKFLSEHTDEEAPNSEKFCGNVLNRFTPGRRFKMVINESKQADYNGCYTIDVVVLTFGGDRYVSRRK